MNFNGSNRPALTIKPRSDPPDPTTRFGKYRRKSPLTCALRGLIAAATVTTVAVSSASNGDWPEFRGPTAQGNSTATNLPIEWSTVKNVTWKQAVPGAGWSSPVVSGGKVFVTSGVSDENKGLSLRALCFDAGTGRQEWTTEVFALAAADLKPAHAKNSPASPTPIVEADRIFVHFGHYGSASLDRAGKIVWRNNRLSYNSVHGNGGSPVLAGDRLIHHADGGSDPFVVALHRNTGEVLWKVPRPTGPRQSFSFSTPLLIAVNGQPQLVSPASGAVFGLDPKDGRELWRVNYGSGYSVIPRPVFGHGLLFVATGYNRAELLAIRPDGAGDVTESHLAWRTVKGAPLTPSMLIVGDELYAVNDAGIASCWDAKNGNLHWQEKLEGNYSASPIAAGGRIYFQSETGTGTVIAASRKFAILATNQLDERTLASYAVAENSLFIRTERHLYRIGNATTLAGH